MTIQRYHVAWSVTKTLQVFRHVSKTLVGEPSDQIDVGHCILIYQH